MNAPTFALENDFIRALPGDPSTERRSRQVLNACYSRVAPTEVSSPTLVAWSDEVAGLLDFPRTTEINQELIDALGGNRLLPGSEPYAACYGGHQFGNWAGQLGDGRAITLGERRNAKSERWELQLKGAGPTPYSRRADGRAVLRSSIREFLCSEAMHHLGVPTTRALSLVATGDLVERDMFYNGNPRMEPGAIVCRVAPSFLRFGNYQILTWRRDVALLKTLVDYSIDRFYPHLEASDPDRIVKWYIEICQRTAVMIAHWMRVGFVHGVMNTDNMSILGLTIDYGPYGWLDDYDSNWTPNTTDLPGRRYCYGNQPGIARWNLLQLGQALAPLIDDVDKLNTGLEQYRDTFNREYRTMLGGKLGFQTVRGESDDALFEELLEQFSRIETDMTLFFRALAEVPIQPDSRNSQSDETLLKPLMHTFYSPDKLTEPDKAALARWLRSYIARSLEEDLTSSQRVARMNSQNPLYVLRNYLAQQAIDRAETGDYSEVQRLLKVMKNPYQQQQDCEQYTQKRPDWARSKAGCSALSCSS